MSTTLRALLLASALTVAPVTVGVLVAGPAELPAPPPYTGTPLSEYDTSTVAVQRAPFCGLIVDDAVSAALEVPAGAEDTVEASEYGNGDRVRVGGTRDVVHEFGCRYRNGRAVAEAWVFAPPVTEQRARTLVRSAAPGSCERVAGAASYGSVSVAVSCPGKRPSIAFHGLFGDAWLSCRLTAADSPAERELLDRAGRWCVAAAAAAATITTS